MQRPKHIELTSEQTRLVEELKHWYRHSSRQWYSYTGPAGTGKTTVVRKAIEELGIERYVTCAFVGKAVTVLARQGLPASTIHSLIYNVVWVPVVDDKGIPVLNQDGNPKMRVEFSLKPSIKDDPQLIIVDEATMVNDDLAEDILSFGIKTVFIGDNNQLPPVFGISSVMVNPDFCKIAEAYNIASRRVITREELKAGIEEMFATKGAYLLEVCTDEEDNVFPMIPSGADISDIIYGE